MFAQIFSIRIPARVYMRARREFALERFTSHVFVLYVIQMLGFESAALRGPSSFAYSNTEQRGKRMLVAANLYDAALRFPSAYTARKARVSQNRNFTYRIIQDG